jgi:deoxyribonuclease V
VAQKLAVDVDYRNGGAVAAGVLFRSWTDDRPYKEILVTLDEVADYVPGAFFLRELPCILKLLESVGEALETIVIDGHVHLGAQRRPGLGTHLYDAIGGSSAVIGVAKRPFKGMPHECELFRGRSRRPLHITAMKPGDWSLPCTAVIGSRPCSRGSTGSAVAREMIEVAGPAGSALRRILLSRRGRRPLGVALHALAAGSAEPTGPRRD